MAKQTLDLYELFRLVVSKGGLVEVINKKLWREITKGLNLPSSITSAAFTLRTQSVHSQCYPQTATQNINELDGQGRARLEAARRRKSEWKVNLGNRNSSRSNDS